MSHVYKTTRALVGRLLRRVLSTLVPTLRGTRWGNILLNHLRQRLPGPWQKLRSRFGPAPFAITSPVSSTPRQGCWKAQERRLLAHIQAHASSKT